MLHFVISFNRIKSKHQKAIVDIKGKGQKNTVKSMAFAKLDHLDQLTCFLSSICQFAFTTICVNLFWSLCPVALYHPSSQPAGWFYCATTNCSQRTTTIGLVGWKMVSKQKYLALLAFKALYVCSHSNGDPIYSSMHRGCVLQCVHHSIIIKS